MIPHHPPYGDISQQIFIHGAASNADFWHEQHTAFPGGHYLNLPGHVSLLPSPKSKVQSSKFKVQGDEAVQDQSPHSAIHTPQSIEAYADWVEGYVLENGLEDVVLHGHSMGGAIALVLALRRPTWLKGLVLTGTGARLRVSPSLLALLRTDYPAAVDMIVQQSLPPLPERLTYKQQIRVAGIRRHILRAPQAITIAEYEACDRFDVTTRLGDVSVPTLCIVGSLDSLTPAELSEYLHTHIPDSRLEIVEGAGHMLPLEKPEEYNERVGEFLRSISEHR